MCFFPEKKRGGNQDSADKVNNIKMLIIDSSKIVLMIKPFFATFL